MPEPWRSDANDNSQDISHHEDDEDGDNDDDDNDNNYYDGEVEVNMMMKRMMKLIIEIDSECW